MDSSLKQSSPAFTWSLVLVPKGRLGGGNDPVEPGQELAGYLDNTWCHTNRFAGTHAIRIAYATTLGFGWSLRPFCSVVNGINVVAPKNGIAAKDYRAYGNDDPAHGQLAAKPPGLGSPCSGYAGSNSTARFILVAPVTQKVDALVTKAGGLHVGTDGKVRQAITALFNLRVEAFLRS
ncbi:hypothetical protein TcWFU_003634 [Taenia crassiceps]|uniref:Uncharacterized protein n=1 Tax=Taenia crassiceps TaxID=6207 RepID=A0ABR4QDE1_9CEST